VRSAVLAAIILANESLGESSAMP